MFTRLARPAMIVAAAAAAITAFPAAASAQSHAYQSGGYVPGYGGQTYNYPDYCDRNRQGRTGAGALVGAGAGAVIGSQLAARGRRTEGSILGGVLGAVVGGAAGRGSGNQCQGYQGYSNDGYAYAPTPAPYSSGYSQGYSQPYSPSYSYAPSYSSSYSSGYSSSYGSGYGGSSVYYDQDGYGPYASDPRHDDRNSGYYDRDDRGRDGCRLAESRIRLPDGRSETRYVRTCPDSSGRYRVVD